LKRYGSFRGLSHSVERHALGGVDIGIAGIEFQNLSVFLSGALEVVLGDRFTGPLIVGLNLRRMALREKRRCAAKDRQQNHNWPS